MELQPTPKDLLGLPGAWYARISLDESKQEIASQRANIERWLKQQGLAVQKHFRFEDAEGYTPRHRPEDRPAFQRLMESVRGGFVKWVIVDHQYRIGGKDEWHYASMIHEFRRAGCQVWTISNELLTGDDGLAFFKGGFGAKSSQHEQHAKAHNVLRGMRRKAKEGEWFGGYVPYALDVVCYKGGNEKWRLRWNGHFQRVRIWPTGSTESFDGKGNMPAVENDEILRLAPGDPDRIRVVEWVFERFANESISTYQLAKALNERRIKPTYGDTWLGSLVSAMLSNPAYIGTPAWNKQGQGDFLEDLGNGPQKVVNTRGRRVRAKTAWVLPEKPVFPPIVPAAIWEQVQKKLDRTIKQRAPKNPDLWLAGLVYCGNCGVKMRGQKRKRYGQFLCQTGDRRRMGKPGIECLRNTLHHELVEKVVDRWLREAGEAIATLAEVQTTGDLGLLTSLEGEFQTCMDNHFKLVERQQRFVERFGKKRALNPDPILANAETHHARVNLTEQYQEDFTLNEKQVNRRKEELELKHSQMMKVIERFENTPRALKKKLEELAELEKEIRESEEDSENVNGMIQEELLRWAELQKLIRDAQDPGKDERKARAKAEALGRLIERIEVFFVPTGKKYPQSLPETVAIVPKSGPPVRYDVSC